MTPPHARRLPPDRAPRTATPRASSTTCARSRAPRSPRWRASSLRRRARALEGLAALHRRRRRRLGHRARRRAAAATSRRPASRPRWPTTSSSRSCASRSPRSSEPADVPDPLDGIVLADKPAGQDLARHHDARARGDCSACARPATPGTLDPFATGLLLVLVGRARRVQRFLMALPKEYVDRRAARRGLDDRRPGRRDHADRAHPAGRPRPARPGASASARRPTAPSASAAARPTSARARRGRSRCPSARSTVHALRAALARGRPRAVPHRVLVRDLRALPDRRPRRRLLRGAAAHAHRAVRRRGRRPAARAPARARRSASCRRVELDADARAARPCHGRRSQSRREADGPPSDVLLVDADGPIALAEQREDGLLKPVVGFRGVKIDPAPRRRAAPAPRRRRHLRRRPPRPPRGDRAAPTPSLTFEPHPVCGHRSGQRAAAADDARAQGRAGRRRSASQELVVIPFDREFAARSAAEFIDDVLVGALGATHVSVGENFHFGNRAQGDAELLRADGRFETRVVAAARGRRRDRAARATSAGSCSAARSSTPARCSARRSSSTGEVAHGDKRGRTLGFPTANLVPREGYVVPGHGVYACRARTADGAGTPRRPTSACARCSRPAAAS